MRIVDQYVVLARYVFPWLHGVHLIVYSRGQFHHTATAAEATEEWLSTHTNEITVAGKVLQKPVKSAMHVMHGGGLQLQAADS